MWLSSFLCLERTACQSAAHTGVLKDVLSSDGMLVFADLAL